MSLSADNLPPRRPNILLVDDNASVRRLVDFLLTRQEMNVQAVSGVDACWAALAQTLPDLILMDVLLEEVNGFDLVEQIKADERYTHVPVIFLTNLAETSDVVKGFELGAVDFLKKPINAPEMLARLQTHLRLAEAERRLSAAHDEAVAASKAKSEFVARVSHEIRTPLNGVMGMLQALLKSNLPAKQQHWSEVAYQSSENLLLLINEVLDFSKMEAGHLEIVPQPFDTRVAFRATVALFKHQAEIKGLAFDASLEPSMPFKWRGDDHRINQIITNLLSNAFKFTKEGLIKLELGADAAGNFIITIGDTGIGISPENYNKLFQPFEQVDSGIARRYGGTGLGLTIIQRLVDMMGGKIEVDSELNVGTTFRIRLPLECLSPASSSERLPLQTVSEETKRENSLRHPVQLNILLAEDSAVNQEVAGMMLEDFGHRVTLANDGVEAIEALSEANFDVVLMDVNMPRKDGIKATEEIRDPTSFVPDHQIYIIALTASTTLPEQENFARAGMQNFVAKPIAEADLFQALSEAIQYQQQRGIELPPTTTTTQGGRSSSQKVSPRIWDIFRSQVDGLAKDFDQALATKDMKQLIRATHTIAGSAAQVGLDHLYMHGKKLEGLAKKGAFVAIGGEASALHAMINALPRTLENNQPQSLV